VKRLLLGIVLGSLASVSFADDFDKKVAVIYLLQDKKVQAELKITEAQREKMNKLSEPYNKKVKAITDKVGKNGPTEAQQKELNAEITKLRASVLNLLTAPQLKRLRELSLQAIGLGALADDVVAAKLGLNQKQVTKIRSELSAGMKALEEAQMSFHKRAMKDIKEPKTDKEREAAAKLYQSRIEKMSKEIETKLSSIRKNTESKVLACLTAEQKTAWKNLNGKWYTG
jgi:DNA-binding ferritin-like protein (Dps family)